MGYIVRGYSRNIARRLGMLFVAVALAGCAGMAAKPETALPQEAVAKRAQARWDALIKSDLDAAYGYLSPGTRSVMSLDLYKAKIRPGMWKKASVESVTCERDRCDIRVMVEYDFRELKSIVRPLEEVWMEADGEWWHVPRK
jgi:hypothetical protein